MVELILNLYGPSTPPRPISDQYNRSPKFKTRWSIGVESSGDIRPTKLNSELQTV
jgi:hypothetical protein